MTMKQIPLSKGKFAIVDDEDFERANQFKWCWFSSKSAGRNSLGYACRNQRENGKKKMIFLHRFIVNAPEGFEVDHKDSDGLNCRKENLRICTGSQNLHNQLAREGGTSRFKGVTWAKRDKKWAARICFEYKRISLGHFADEVEAAKAYDEAAKKYFGEFAYLNFKE